MPRVIAHRGASGTLPENTLPAYELACEQQADMIEVDLHRTRDGAIVIRHDAELEPLGGRGDIGEVLLEEVRALDAGGGSPVPTLDEILDGFGARIPFNLELKQSEAGPYPGMEAEAAQAVTARGLLAETLFSSFYDPVLAALAEVSPASRRALLVSRRYPHEMFARAAKLGVEAVNPERPLVDSELVERAHGEGLAVYVFTVNEPDDMHRLLDLGVDGLFTDHPARMRALLAERGVARA